MIIGAPRALVGLLAVTGVFFAAQPAMCRPLADPPVVAGSGIANVAHAMISVAGGNSVITSNIATIRIDERLDIALYETVHSGSVGIGTRGIGFVVTNRGNGNEAFVLAGSIDQIPASFLGFAVDTDGNSLYDPAVDTLLAGNATAMLAPGQSLTLLVVVRFDAPGQGTIAVTASASTGSGTPGTFYTGKGDGGGDAVVGSTRATASLSFRVAIDSSADPITLLKAQAVSAPDGSAAPVSGATVTYSIQADFTGTSPIRAARFADPIPANTSYVAGSLQIDGVAMSDADDSDSGSFDGHAVRITLGDVIAPARRTIQFKVSIQ